MPDLFEAAAIAGQGIAFDRGQNFVVGQRGLAGTRNEFVNRQTARLNLAIAAARKLDHRIMRE